MPPGDGTINQLRDIGFPGFYFFKLHVSSYSVTIRTSKPVDQSKTVMRPP